MRNRLFCAFQKLVRASFFRKSIILAGGVSAAQVLTAIFSPFLTRLYGSESIGVLGMLFAILAVGAPLVALSYPWAIPLPKNDIQAVALGRLSALIGIGVSVLSGAIAGLIYAFAPERAIEPYRDVIMILPAAMLVVAFQQIPYFSILRSGQLYRISVALVIAAFVTNLLYIGGGVFFPFTKTLLAIAVLGYAAQASMLWLAMSGGCFRGLVAAGGQSERGSVLNVARQYSEFPKYRAPQNSLNAVSQWAPVVFLGYIWGPSVAGYYTIAHIVLVAPVMLVAKAVGEVAYSRISKEHREGQPTLRVVLNITTGLSILGAAPYLIVAVFGPAIFAFVFGNGWEQSGRMAQWLSVFFFFAFINKAFVACVPHFGMQKDLFLYEVLATGAKLGSLLCGVIWFDNVLVAIGLFAVAGSLSYVMMMAWIFRGARRQEGWHL